MAATQWHAKLRNLYTLCQGTEPALEGPRPSGSASLRALGRAPTPSSVTGAGLSWGERASRKAGSAQVGEGFGPGEEFVVLELQDVTAGYGDVTVLRDVTMAAPTGSVIALLGPNGAGKTTLLRTISGLVMPTAGRVIFDGNDVTSLRTYQMARRGVCHIPEGRGIFPSLTLKENLSLFSPRGKVKETFETAAETFPILGQRLNQTAGSLSGGEQQMLAIIRAYISKPKIVLVDEASMGLAPLVIDSLFRFLTQVAKEGTTLIIVEQYVTRALELADTVYLLNNGRMAFSGAASEISGAEIFEKYLGVNV
jgi:branched-chain amino acid transport system ATP-binding protein